MLADTGPLVAMVDARDPYHQRCVAMLTQLRPAVLVTTWPCFTEAIYLAGRSGGYPIQDALWQLRERGVLRLHNTDSDEADRMRALMAEYRDTPMDLADASLVAAAETLAVAQILTFDSHFFVYRTISETFLAVSG